MSASYYIDLVIPLISTQDMISNIVTNVKQFGPLSFSYWNNSTNKYEQIDFDKAPTMAWAGLSSTRYSTFVTSLPCYEPDCPGRSWDDSLGWEHAEPVALRFFREAEALIVGFEPEGSGRFRRDYGIGIDFQWYISKLLAITRPYPLAKLIAQCDYQDKIIPTEWKVEAVLADLGWTCLRYPVLKETNRILQSKKTFFTTLENNSINSGYKFIDFDIEHYLKVKHPFIFPIQAEWGMATIVINDSTLSIIPFNSEDKPLDLRPYLQMLSDLTVGCEIRWLEAFNGIGYRQTTDSSFC